jgi:hypothetical protein
MPHPLGRAPSKIIAVHLNYRGRTRERGRLPAYPSYFLKPPSSLAETGDLSWLARGAASCSAARGLGGDQVRKRGQGRRPVRACRVDEREVIPGRFHERRPAASRRRRGDVPFAVGVGHPLIGP